MTRKKNASCGERGLQQRTENESADCRCLSEHTSAWLSTFTPSSLCNYGTHTHTHTHTHTLLNVNTCTPTHHAGLLGVLAEFSFIQTPGQTGLLNLDGAVDCRNVCAGVPRGVSVRVIDRAHAYVCFGASLCQLRDRVVRELSLIFIQSRTRKPCNFFFFLKRLEEFDLHSLIVYSA